MKRLFLFLGSAIILFAAGCGESSVANTPQEATSANTKQAAAVPDKSHPDYVTGSALVKKSDCLSCHHETKKIIGPSYQEIAAKFPKVDSTYKTFANKIIKGSKGEWGDVEMTPHPALSHEEATQMAKYIMVFKVD